MEAMMSMMGGGESSTKSAYESMDTVAIALNASKRIAKAQKKKIKSATRTVRRLKHRLKEWRNLALVARTGVEIGAEIGSRFRKLYRMCENNSRLHKEVMEHHFVANAVAWIHEEPSDADMMGSAVHFLVKIIRLYPKTAAIYRAAALRHHLYTAIAIGMKQCADHSEVQGYCADAAVELSSVPDVVDENATEENRDYSIYIISDTMGDESTRSGDHHARSLAGKHHLLEALLRACDKHVREDEMQQQCLHAIGHLCYDHEKNRKIAEQLHAVGIVARSIVKHPRKGPVQTAGLYALAMMCHHSERMQHAALERQMPTEADYEREKRRLMKKSRMKGGAGGAGGAGGGGGGGSEEDIILMGGVITLPPGRFLCLEPVVDAIASHIRDRNLCLYGIVALNNICGADGRHQMEILEVEGHVAIRLAMQAHLADEEIQRLAMHALGTISQHNADAQSAVLEAGALLNITKAMAKHNDKPKLLLEGIAAIGELGSIDAVNQRAVVEGHAADAIIKAAKVFSTSDPDVAEEACRALGNIGRENPWTSEYISAAGAIEIVTHSMRSMGAEHVGVDIAGAWAIGHLANHAMQNSSLRDHHTESVVFTGTDALSLLCVGMRRRQNDPVLQGACSFAVARLARGNHYHQNEIEMCGMTKLLLQAYRTHPEDEQIQNWSRVALALCRIDVESPNQIIESHSRQRVPPTKSASLGELSRYGRRPKQQGGTQVGYFVPSWNEGTKADETKDGEKRK
jgi:hypothetical protein